MNLSEDANITEREKSSIVLANDGCAQNIDEIVFPK